MFPEALRLLRQHPLRDLLHLQAPLHRLPEPLRRGGEVPCPGGRVDAEAQRGGVGLAGAREPRVPRRDVAVGPERRLQAGLQGAAVEGAVQLQGPEVPTVHGG